MVDQHSQAGRGDDKKLSSEGVVVRVIGGTELDEDEVAGGDGGDYEDNLHQGVVDGHIVGGQVEVARDEDQSEQNLTLTGDTCSQGAPGRVTLIRAHRAIILPFLVLDPGSPAQERVFHILASSRSIARRWERSPISLNTFIALQSSLAAFRDLTGGYRCLCSGITELLFCQRQVHVACFLRRIGY